MNLGMIAVFLVIIIVIGSILTRKCEPFLIGGSIAGAVFLYRQNFLPQWVTILENVMSSEAYLILVCGLFGSIIALLTASKRKLWFFQAGVPSVQYGAQNPYNNGNSGNCYFY